MRHFLWPLLAAVVFAFSVAQSRAVCADRETSQRRIIVNDDGDARIPAVSGNPDGTVSSSTAMAGLCSTTPREL